MTPAELARLGRALYGPGWQSPMARAVGVNPRTVRRWASGDCPISAPAERLIRLMFVAERINA